MEVRHVFFPFRRYNICVFSAEVNICIVVDTNVSKQCNVVFLAASSMQFSVDVDQLWVEGYTFPSHVYFHLSLNLYFGIICCEVQSQ